MTKKEHSKDCGSHPDSKHYHQPCSCYAGRSKEMQKVLTLLKGGKNFVENTTGNVRNVKSEKNLLKTISNHFQQVEQIISQIFNHFVGRAIVENGNFIKILNY